MLVELGAGVGDRQAVEVGEQVGLEAVAWSGSVPRRIGRPFWATVTSPAWRTPIRLLALPISHNALWETQPPPAFIGGAVKIEDKLLLRRVFPTEHRVLTPGERFDLGTAPQDHHDMKLV